MTESPQIQRLQRVLRSFIVAEIIISIFIVVASFFQESLLPRLLLDYRGSVESPEFNLADALLGAAGILALILSIASWVALWRGWRIGRRLYLGSWTIFFPMIIFSGPLVELAPMAVLDALVHLVGGVIIGLLYFSELRELYDRKD